MFNHSVTTGVRWYELRATPGPPFTVYQQGTYAPDATYRWMGSAAMDQASDLAVGYSASSSSIKPAVRYSGRLPGDALGPLDSESTIIQGAGAQTNGLHRCGATYSSLRIDPSDDCTFWYINEYLQADGSPSWSTRIGSFKFPSCGATLTPTTTRPWVLLRPTPPPMGHPVTFTATVAPSGATGTVTFYDGASLTWAQGL